MKAILDHIHNEGVNITTFWFRPEKELQYTAGQYIEMTIDHPNPDEKGTRRKFTLSSSPTSAPLISITTRFGEESSSSYRAALRRLNIGDSVHVSEAIGDFVLTKDPTIPLVFIAGGIGITPFHSIIQFLKDTGQTRSIHLLHAVHDVEEQIFRDLFEQATFLTYTPIIEHPPEGWEGQVGRLSGERILSFIGEVTDQFIYLSGPELMIEALRNELVTAKVPKAQLVTDLFEGIPTY